MMITRIDLFSILGLLAPLSSPTELPTHPSMARAFTSRTVRNLARRAMDIINEEHKHTVQFSRLMGVFLGDDPMYLKVDKLNLPIYDHLNGVVDPNDGPANKINGDEILTSSSTNGSKVNSLIGQSTNITSSNLSSAPSSSTPSVLKSKFGPSSQLLSSDLEPFFGLPQIHVDRDYGIKSDDAEDARQLTQIAQQRSEEFIRCMVKVRQGLLRAERYQSKVYHWCREMAGDEDDSDGMEHFESSTKQSSNNDTKNGKKK